MGIVKKVVRTNTFQVAVPATFTEEKIAHEAFSVWNPNVPFERQFPIINLALSEVKDLTEAFAGDNYEQIVHAYYAIKRYNIVRAENETITIQGKTAYLQRAVSEVPKEGRVVEVFHLFVNIPLDDVFMQEFSADCELPLRAQYEPIFLDTIRSIEWFGDFRHYIDLQEAAQQEQNQRIDALLERVESPIVSVKADEPEPSVPAFAIPADGQNVFRIGDFDFEIGPDESQWSISEFSKTLGVTVAAHLQWAKPAIEAQLLDDYRTDGRVKLSFEAHSIYQAGLPVGSFALADDKTESLELYLYLQSEGLDYRLHFFGNITFVGEWVGINGHFRVPYENNPGFPVTVYKRLNPNQLDWSNYQFRSIKEAQQAPDHLVRFLSLTNPSFEALPEETLRYKNLVQLHIFNQHHEPLPLASLPEGIGDLVHLQNLTIAGTSLEHLPDSLGRLRELEYLGLSNNRLSQVPLDIWQLPKLKYLHLRNNRLSEVPSALNLPNLEALSLTENALTTLPAALARQPQLRTLELENNPWQSLPEDFNQIKEIRMSINDKRRLLDFEYRGADSQGLVEWNDEVFYARSDESLRSYVKEVIQLNELDEYREALVFLVKKAIGFTHRQEEDYATVGNHRFGGMPDLPASIPYPRFYREYDKATYAYEFIAQINCAALADQQDYLPRSGMLYFFLTTLHDIYGGSEPSPARVIYYDGKQALQSGQQLRFEESDYFEMIGSGYAGYQVAARPISSSPAFYAIYQNEYLLRGPAAMLEDSEFLEDDLYMLFEEALSEKNEADYKINSYGFSQHQYPEHEASLALKGNPEDWVILLEVASRGDFQWGDAGELFFVIHKSDLMKKDFSNVFCTMYSS